MIKLVQVKKVKDYNITKQKNTVHYELDEIWINPDSILQVKTDSAMKYNLTQGYLPADLDGRQEFSSVQFGAGNNVSSVVVVGAPDVVAEKIHKISTRKVLRG